MCVFVSFFLYLFNNIATLHIILKHRLESCLRNLGNFDGRKMISWCPRSGVGSLICVRAS